MAIPRLCLPLILWMRPWKALIIAQRKRRANSKQTTTEDAETCVFARYLIQADDNFTSGCACVKHERHAMALRAPDWLLNPRSHFCSASACLVPERHRYCSLFHLAYSYLRGKLPNAGNILHLWPQVEQYRRHCPLFHTDDIWGTVINICIQMVWALLSRLYSYWYHTACLPDILLSLNLDIFIILFNNGPVRRHFQLNV